MTYLDYYNEIFAPKLKAIDLLMKTEGEKISIDITCDLLDLTASEVIKIMESFNIKELDRINFFTIMRYGDSKICHIFSREIQRKMPYFYSFYDISYIYQIPYDIVVDAANQASLANITDDNLNELFSHIDYNKTCVC